MKKLFMLGLLLSALGLMACDDDKPDNSIGISDIEDNSVSIVFPRSNPVKLTVTGGNGRYQATSERPDMLTVEIDGSTLRLIPLANGVVDVTIKDGASGSYLLSVKSYHAQESYAVGQIIPVVEGDRLTIAEKEAVEERVLAAVTAKQGEKYNLTYTLADYAGGNIFNSPAETGDPTWQGSFTRRTLSYDNNRKSYLRFDVTVDNVTRVSC